MDSSATSEYRPLLNQGGRGNLPAYNSRLNVQMEGVPITGGGGESPPEKTEYKRWPWFVWLLLKIIGLYTYRRIVTSRLCHLCHFAVLRKRQHESGEGADGHGLYLGVLEDQSVDGEDDDEGEDGKNDGLVGSVDENMNAVNEGDGPRSSGKDDGGCPVCRSEWWNEQGMYRPYSDTDTGASRWNHYGSAILSIVWPLTLITVIMYDFFVYLHFFWGHKKQLIRLISFSTFLTFNMSSPLLSLVANVRNMMADRGRTRRSLGFRWYEALGMRYIVKRLQHLGLGERGLPRKAYLAVCLLWPCLNGSYRAFIYYYFVWKGKTYIHVQISLAAGMVGMIVWGNFCYLMFLLRLSFQRQQRLELGFLWRHSGQTDVCRRRLALYAEELGSMCRLVSVWIILVVAVSTWAFTTQICWDYDIMSTDHHFKNATLELNINVLIWSENTMFLILPLVAIGGIDLNKLWVQFMRCASRMKCEAQEDFWDKILAFCEEQSPVYRVETLTLMFSALGLFLGLHFGDQNVAYWNRPTHNTTAVPLLANIIPAT